MKNAILFILLVFFSTAFKCVKYVGCPEDGGHKELKIKNETGAAIYYQLHWFHPGEYGANDPSGNKLNSGDTRTLSAGDYCWESVFKTEGGETRSLRIYDADSLDILGWEVVETTNRGLMKTLKLDLNYLIQNQFLVTID